ncbi:uncharacterized protein LOC127869101 [Dreissena polymorpha]|uniref:B box-type domain-containing protein n=1 Tax=Dreissena polymorpha TaxID=45954 RepID=A0A9D4RM13_DREPO|nr:uncharacterized protein LOC127869101 [Dreissena polymorpha]XP_052267376.1 uncharacterized protein LOC127869101 [Dreissena polymorpha]XP_052267377.1 uncharacterized protein LOC127869101 [Dreissena polymorpha]XP_052267378.1 uncharacterized protein LOC127869101 [Dreissena polymorpha]XP_052267379.1 uncharacterized protein LOC127869101 [Dreissena polymorpha]XP_052267381.1 uncharacterized protein LOC127869101 [Dreissena polymorpha]XP_052267382.1 uncharacterized protein LOC127869101 [Dreissena po
MATFPVSSGAEEHVVDKEYCCSICEEHNTEINATFYCKKCNKFFCGQCIHSHSKHGLWFNKQSPYGKDKIMKWPLSKKMENYLLTCDIHKDEQLTKFCKDHSRLCCYTCVVLDHSRCTQVKVFSEVKRQSSDVKKLSVRVSKTLSRLKKLQSYREDNRRSMQGSYAEFERNKVKTMRLNIQSFLVQCDDTSMNETFETMEYTLDEIRQKVNLLLTEFENCSIKEQKEKLKLKQAPLISVIKTCIRHHGELLPLHEAMQKVKYQPELSLIAHYKCLDKIQQCEIYMNENFSDELFSVKGVSKYKVRIFRDSNTCLIIAVCALPDGQVLVADWLNYKVKLLNQQYQVVSHWGVNARAWDMCLITPSEAAVALGDHGVQFITVTQSKLVPGRRLQLQQDCYAIVHHKGDLFICSKTALYKYSLSGTLVCRLYEDTSASDTVYKCAVSPTGDRLYITNPEQNKLLTLARDGTLLATFTDPALRSPCGLHVTPAGQVLVCGWGPYTILQVGWEGESKLATLATQKDGVSWPQSVCYSSTTSSIIVGQYRDNIVVFRVE